jgi:hypothetical protein
MVAIMTSSDYHNVTDLNWWLKWIACWITLIGAVATSAGLDPYNVYLLNVGAAIYLWWSIRIRETSLIVINFGLLAIYVVGTVTRILN